MWPKLTNMLRIHSLPQNLRLRFVVIVVVSLNHSSISSIVFQDLYVICDLECMQKCDSRLILVFVSLYGDGSICSLRTCIVASQVQDASILSLHDYYRGAS